MNFSTDPYKILYTWRERNKKKKEKVMIKLMQEKNQFYSNQIVALLPIIYKVFIIRGFRTIVFIFIVISTTFRPICPPAFFRCLSHSGTFTELRTTSFIESTGVACCDSVSHNRGQVLSIPVLLLACSQDRTCNLQMIVSSEAKGTNAYVSSRTNAYVSYNPYAMCPAGHIA